MKLESPWFDGIRIGPRAERAARDARAAAATPGCDHPGCGQPGGFRAPKGRDREGQYFNFCVEHVRAYNQSYDYFRGMSDEALASYEKAAATGHRPTWTMGVNGWAKAGAANRAKGAPRHDNFDYADPFNLFGGAKRKAEPQPEAKPVRNVERKSLETLSLDVTATGPEIKARYKELVKRLHPDANGGDRGSEDKLRDIIQAYKYLRQAGFC
jgi:hypothetical protein